MTLTIYNINFYKTHPRVSFINVNSEMVGFLPETQPPYQFLFAREDFSK